MRILCIWVMIAVGYFSFHTETSFAGTTATLKQSGTFINAAGSEVVLHSGAYSVSPVGQWLQLIPQGGTRRDAILLKAQPIRHSEAVRSPSVRFTESGQQGELVLLLPGGQGRRALGVLENRPLRGFAAKALTPDRSTILTPQRVEPAKKKSPVFPKFSPDDPWDKALFTMIQTLQSRVKKLEMELSTLKQQYAKHQHEYTVPVFGEGGAAWVTIKQLRKMKDDKTQSLDKYGMYFRGKANSQKPLPTKDTSGPKH